MRALSSDHDIKLALTEAKTIAIIGMSKNETKASFFVGRYMQRRGYRVIPINPVYAGDSILDETVLAQLSDVPQDVTIDIVDIFRRSEFVPQIVDQAIDCLTPLPKTIWMQFGIQQKLAPRPDLEPVRCLRLLPPHPREPALPRARVGGRSPQTR